MPQMPTLGPQPKSRGVFGTVVLIAAVAGLSGGGVYLFTRPSTPAPQPEKPQPAALAAEPVIAPAGAELVDAGGAALAVAPPPPVDSKPLGWKAATIRITGPLETAVVEAAGRDVGPALTQVITRSLVWWVEVPADLKRDDVIEVLYQERAGEEPLVHALRFRSEKLGKTVSTYRFQPPGDAYARYYQPDGSELELRLKSSPIDEYEQITSLLRDGRRHKGVDFKAPVGTPVKAPFAGTVTRKNWNFRGNGNSIELAGTGGKKALFLHLAELPSSVQVGMRVTPGQVLAESGNTGRSFAPHLHYQLMQGEAKVLDPFDVHETYRRTLGASEVGGLKAEIDRLDAMLPTQVALGAAP